MNKDLKAIQKQCRQRAKELGYLADPEKRAVAARDNADWVSNHMLELKHAHDGVEEQYWKVRQTWFGARTANAVASEIHEQVRRWRRYEIGRAAAMIVEALAGAVLAAVYFEAPLWMAIPIGVLLALLLGSVASALVSSWTNHDAADQPTKQEARITRALILTGIPWLIACVTALAVLRTDATDEGGWLFAAATTAVTALSPIMYALCTAGAELTGWSRHLCGQMRWIRSLVREMDQLNALAKRSILPSNGSLLGSAGVAALLVGGIVGLVPSANAADLPVYLYADVSPSPRHGEVPLVLRKFSDGLLTYEGEESLAISLVAFYEDAFTAPTVIRVVIPGAAPFICPLQARKGDLVKLSKAYRESARRDLGRRCEVLGTQTRQARSVERAAEVARLNAAIDHLVDLKIPGHCTAVNSILRRAAAEAPNGVSLVVSDMESDCSERRPPLNLQADNRVFIAPVGTRAHPIEEEFERIQSRVARMMPSARVVELFRLREVFETITHPESQLSARR